MVKGRRRPSIRTMALGTSMAEIILHVIGIAHRVVIIDMASIAIGRRPAETVGMAGEAFQCSMSSRKREIGQIMVKGRW